jgi:succinate dehydrogenase/fumarate reductase-like Fe-S protein
MNKYLHDEVIRAWLDGKTVQQYSWANGVWEDIENFNCWSKCPSFHRMNSYRIKPKTIKIKFRIWLSLSNDTYISRTKETETELPKLTHFKMWLTDWIEKEIEE